MFDAPVSHILFYNKGYKNGVGAHLCPLFSHFMYIMLIEINALGN
jgi:hypothetical protein